MPRAISEQADQLKNKSKNIMSTCAGKWRLSPDTVQWIGAITTVNLLADHHNHFDILETHFQPSVSSEHYPIHSDHCTVRFLSHDCALRLCPSSVIT